MHLRVSSDSENDNKKADSAEAGRVRRQSACAERQASGGRTNINMKLKILLDQLEIVSATADPETEILGISYDSRKTEKGDLFVAIRGFETDGHRFIPKAIEKKAAVILCETPPEQEVPFIRVRDSRRALAVCSSVFYGNPSVQMRMIGITGTSGKTSVSMLLKHVLEETRGAKVGFVPEEKVIGKVVLRYSPFKEFKIFNY